MNTAVTIISFVTGIVSLIVGMFAVWLSVVLYRFSNDAQEQIRGTAERVEKAVSVLDEQLRYLHADTFSLVRETFGDMRAAVWSTRNDDTTDDSAATIAATLTKEMTSLREQLLADISKVTSVTGSGASELHAAVDTAIRHSVDAGLMVRDEVVHRAILHEISKAGSDGCVAAAVVTAAGQEFPFGVVVRGLKNLRASGHLRWSGELQPLSVVHVTTPEAS
ncbi:hypothetical protein [Micromonospora sp. NBC_01739]|uniref:hypothetical protein n=1 Tax=Micromonospora sp. NBC_01739 TaxID=2975985 RepID=UPI002E15835D|nr:hypothetical protein OIE53_08750 [Micromonospora sp. NBC_01739]